MNVTALKSRQEERRPRMVVDRATLHYQTKSGPLHALDNVSLEVRDGEFLCIIGPSGCGKTTLLWSMAGLHQTERRRDHASTASRSRGRTRRSR